LTDLPGETVNIEVFGATRRGRRARLVRREVRLAASGDGRGEIERPRPGATVAPEPIFISGFALPRNGLISRVRLFVNGDEVARARLGGPRPDLSGSSKTESPICGFEYVLDLTETPVDSEVVLGAVAHSTDGTQFPLDEVAIKVRLPENVVEVDHDRIARLQDRVRRITLGRPRPDAKTIRLVAFTHHLGYGGGQLYLYELLRQLRIAPGISATVVAPNDGPLRHDFESIGVPVHVTGDYPLEPEQYEARVAEIVAWMASEGFNVAVVNTTSSFFGADAASRLDLPVLWAIHESFHPRAAWTLGYQAIHPHIRAQGDASLGTASAVIFEADATKRLYEAYGDAARFITIPYGISIPEIDAFRRDFDENEIRSRLDIPDDAIALLCLGTIEPRKGQGLLAKAFSLIADAHPSAMLIFVGDRFDRYSEGLRAFIDRAGLGPRTRILPVVSETYPLYGLADVFVCASDVESLPRSVLEAMAFEVPVLATRVFGLPELIEDGSNGFLCDHSDVEELTRALDRILTMDDETRRAIGAEGARVVRTHHDSRGYADAYHSLMKAMLADPEALPEAGLRGSDVNRRSDMT
jgi:glycosyltransferase involved in cell wall biosynthesis